jgi:hypothetical protein
MDVVTFRVPAVQRKACFPCDIALNVSRDSFSDIFKDIFIFGNMKQSRVPKLSTACSGTGVVYSFGKKNRFIECCVYIVTMQNSVVRPNI